jgi:hypothetical protein
MDSRTKGIIATIASVLLCGCPGFFLCVFGGLAAAGAPVTTGLNELTNTGQMAPTTAYVLLCLGLIFLVIPVVVGIVTLRNKPAPAAPSNPIPPAS